MEKKLGFYGVLASLATSIVIVLIFYVLAMGKVNSPNQEMYKIVDVYAGMVYVFVLSMIVSASIWPGIIEKRFMK